MQSRIDEIRKKEAVNEERRTRIRHLNTAKDEENRRSIEPKLAEIDFKLNTSAEKHRDFLQERSNSITFKPDPREKVQTFRTM